MFILDTERLRLREFTPQDAPFLRALTSEPGWQRNISDPGIRTDAQALAWMEERLFRAYRDTGHGFWAVQRRSDGELLGLCGLSKRPALPQPDLGYALLARHEGQGYASEAAAGCVAHARDHFGWPELLAITAVHNARSAALLTKLGFVEEETRLLDGYTEPSRHFRLRF